MIRRLGERWKDRALEELLRSVPPWGTLQPTLVIWMDGMDQAHWAIPRYRGLRPSKGMEKFVRPRCKVQGVWVFWMSITFYIMDCTLPHNANATVETLARSLEGVFQQAAARNLPPPKEVVIWVPYWGKTSLV